MTMTMSESIVVFVDLVEDHRIQCKQMHHQIPTSSRDGGDQTLQTTADVLRCGAQIETWGVRFVLGGWRCVSPPWFERLFTPRQHLWHPPRRTPHRTRNIPRALGILDFLAMKHPSRLRPTAGFESSTSHKPKIPAGSPPLPPTPRSAFWTLQDWCKVTITWSPRFKQQQKEKKKISFGLCSGETETSLKSSPGGCQEIIHLIFTILAAAVRPAGSSAPENPHMSKESSWWDSKRKKNITTRAANITERVNRCNGAQKGKQVTGNSKQQCKKGKVFETDCSHSFLWMAQRSPYGF